MRNGVTDKISIMLITISLVAWSAGPAAALDLNPFSMIKNIVEAAVEDRSSEDIAEDLRIKAAIIADVIGEMGTDVISISSDVYEQDVRLTRSVEKDEQKKRAENPAKAIEGVKKIYNEISVKKLSDKKKGVVFLALADLKRRGHIGQLKMVGTNGTKFPDIRNHLQRQIADVYRDMDGAFTSFPDDHTDSDPTAYLGAMDAMDEGDAVVVFTPDDTHYEIGQAAIERGLHVLLAKPPVKTLEHHIELVDLARKNGVVVGVEVHKRWDPIYMDAVAELRRHGDFSYFYSYMSQPKKQLDTFRDWAGQSSDISYYLNAHHIDLSILINENMARPLSVSASSATGVANSEPYNLSAEDLITLMVEWQTCSGNKAVGVYTASWIEPEGDVHSRQGFTCIMHAGRVEVQQDYRGYKITVDGEQVESRNPLFMKYSPDAEGHFNGQNGYGYISIAKFIEAVDKVLNGERSPEELDSFYPTASKTIRLTAVLEAGRKSLDSGRKMDIKYEHPTDPDFPTAIVPAPVG